MQGWQVQRLPGKVVVYTSDAGVVACAGIGVERALLAVQAAMSVRPVTALVSVGLAGACDPALRAGDIVRATVVVDAKTGERFGSSFPESDVLRVLVSTAAIASTREKNRLFESYGASAVDMEASAVARLARMHGLEFQAIKAISDEADFEMQELGRFATHDGQFREGAFAAYAALRPRMWGRLVRLAANSGRAVEALTLELKSQLDWYRQRD